MTRAEPIARWIAIALIVASAVHGIATISGTYADGIYDLYTMLEGRWLIDGHRAFSALVTQWPAWFGMALGVTNVHVLAVLHSVGVVGVPTLGWAAALLLLRHHRLFWPMVVVFAVVSLNSGLVSIGQYNLLYAYLAVAVALLVRPTLSQPGATVLVVLSVLMFRTYEGVFYLGPPLAALAIITWRMRRSRDGIPRYDGIVRLVVAAILIIDATAGMVTVIFPSDPTNRAGAARVFEPFSYNAQLTVSAAVGLLLVLAFLVLRGRALDVACIVLAVVPLVILAPALQAQPWMHYHARTTTGLLMLVLLALALWRELRPPRGDAEPPRLVWVAATTLLVVQLVWFSVSTQGVRNWVGLIEQALADGSGEIALHETAAVDEFPRYGWPWTNPYLSVVLRPAGSDAVVLSPGKNPGEEVIPAPLADRFGP